MRVARVFHFLFAASADGDRRVVLLLLCISLHALCFTTAVQLCAYAMRGTGHNCFGAVLYPVSI